MEHARLAQDVGTVSAKADVSGELRMNITSWQWRDCGAAGC